MSNNPIDPWIADFVSQCLSSYLSPQQTGVEVGNDGTALRFKIPGFAGQAVVSDCGLGLSRDKAILMDRGNQIDATLSLESLATPNPLLPEAQSIKDGPRKHQIGLLDFSLVFTYSTPTPEVHIHVERFQVDWDKGLIKCAPSKKLRKLEHIRSLLADTYEAVNSSQSRGSNGAESPSRAFDSPHDKEHQSNAPQRNLLSQNLSQDFASQLPAQDHESLERNATAAHPQLHASADLLQRLGRPSSLALNKPSLQSTQAQSHSERVVINSRGKQSIYRQHSPLPNVSESHREGSISSQPRDDNFLEDEAALSTQPGVAVADIANFETQPPSNPRFNPLGEHDAPRDHSPKKRRRESSAAVDQAVDDELNRDIPSKKRLRSRENGATDNTNLMRGDTPVTVNPWAGLIEIPAKEVIIENDQAELLENDKMLWIPPNPGQQMPQGHVPPSLLRKWNSIAEQRQRLSDTQVDQNTSESPVTPTQRTTDTTDPIHPQKTPSEWEESPTPERQKQLPDSSPIKQPGLARRDTSQSQSPTKRHTTQKTRLGSTGGVSAANEVLQPNHDLSENITLHSSGLQTQTPLVPGRGQLEGDLSLSSTQVQHEQPPESDAPLGSTGPISHPSISQPSQEGLAMQRVSPSQSPTPDSPMGQEDDSDDESMMDTSVPLALGEQLPDPTQSSQAEQEITSSGSSLPGVNSEHVQVIETPMAGNNNVPHQIQSIQDQPQSSYQAHESSSQSRVMNTYPMHGSLDKGEFSQETSNLSGQSQEGQPLRVDVPGTQPQPSSMDFDSQFQNGLHQSQSEVVFDSSGPAQRQQYFSQSDPSSSGPSSHEFASSHQPFVSQADESIQDSTGGGPSPSGVKSSAPVPDPGPSPPKSPRFSPPKITGQLFASQPSEPIQDSAGGKPTPSKSSGRLSPGVDECSQISLEIPLDGLAARPEPPEELEELSEAEKAHRKFRLDYPIYTGDFNHFVELCSRLGVLRSQCQLQSSSLWDDFIIMHVQRYLPHCQERAAHDCPSYEVFFALNCSQPLYTKGSLTALDIDQVASHCALPMPSSTTLPPNPSALSGLQDQPASSSFTTSLTDKFHGLYAHSFHDVRQNEEPLGTQDLKGHTMLATSPTPSIEIKQEGSDSDSDEPLRMSAYSAGFSRETLVPSLELTMDQKVDGKVQRGTSDTGRARKDVDIDTSEVEETDTEKLWHQSDDEESDADNDFNSHRAASVELGDDTFVSTSAQPRSNVASEEPVESDGEDDSWFSSFRHRQSIARTSSTGGRWYDDPNTPFKHWAIADQNVLSERYRRGRAWILENERGEIRRPNHR